MIRAFTLFCFLPFYAIAQKADSLVNLYAFLGEKIALTAYPADSVKQKAILWIDSTSGDTAWSVKLMTDNGFVAKYKVIQWVYNTLQLDTLEFHVFDHYGRPAFESELTVLLYVTRGANGNYYHEKYQFDYVRKTPKGHWVGKNGESLSRLFLIKKEKVFKPRGLFH